MSVNKLNVLIQSLFFFCISVASKAFYARIDLSAHGFFAIDDSRCGYDWNIEKPSDFDENKPENSFRGNPFNYFTQGVAYAEVEIDVLTGSHRTLQSDVIVDGEKFFIFSLSF